MKYVLSAFNNGQRTVLMIGTMSLCYHKMVAKHRVLICIFHGWLTLAWLTVPTMPAGVTTYKSKNFIFHKILFHKISQTLDGMPFEFSEELSISVNQVNILF